jgi:hypothetical protein
MKIVKYTLLMVTVLGFAYMFGMGVVSASSCPASDYDCQIGEIQGEIDALTPAHESNKKELSNLRIQVSSLGKRIDGILSELENVEENINTREEDLAFAQRIFEEKANNHYRFLRLYDPITPFLSSSNASLAFREISFRLKAIDEDRKTMEIYADDLLQLKNDKEELEKNKESLAGLKTQLGGRAEFLGGEVEKVESYLATLSAKQEQLVALKSAGFQTSIGDTPLTLEPCSGPPGSANFCDPGFRPAFSAFSFGAPHRTGMSQYGAYGRSKSGQSAEDILSAYYKGASLNKGYGVPDTIGVDGIGRVSFEDNYLLGIYEIPESWGDKGGFEALKAQAVAARSYALAVTGGGAGSICTSESCQVYKPQLKSGKWAEAVRATRGWVLIKDGAPAKAYYASTSGGFTVSQWSWEGIVDTVGGSVGNWPGQAYESIAGSPWFYKGWYKSRGGATCGRSNPWLKSEELADVLNAWKIVYQGGGDVSRVTPIDVGCWGGNPYNVGELASIGGFTSVSSASVVYDKSGSTQSVILGTNKGSVTISGGEFKKAFNLRAPGYIGVKSSLFNIEKL